MNARLLQLRHAALALGSAAAILLLGTAASAVPLTYNVLPSSTLTADIVGELEVTVFSNVGTFPGTGMVSGALNATPQGTITADWGSPNWADQLDLSDISVDNPNPGTVTGNVAIDVGILGTQNFALTIDVDNISLGLDSPVSTSPLTPSESAAGPGPWTSFFPSVPVVLGATASGSADGLVDININPFSFGSDTPIDIPIAGALSRVTDGSGTDIGSRLEVPIPSVDFSVPTGDPVSQPAPGCELSTFFCAVNVTSVELQITSLDFQNVTGMINAEELTTPIPEPGTALLLGGGLLGLLAAGSRFKRS